MGFLKLWEETSPNKELSCGMKMNLLFWFLSKIKDLYSANKILQEYSELNDTEKEIVKETLAQELKHGKKFEKESVIKLFSNVLLFIVDTFSIGSQWVSDPISRKYSYVFNTINQVVP